MARLCSTGRAWRALAITESRWLLPSLVYSPRAKPLFKMPTASANLIRDLKPCWKSLATRDGCRSARLSSAHLLLLRSRKRNSEAAAGHLRLVRRIASPRERWLKLPHVMHFVPHSQASHRVVAIDGPAASGKSSVARKLAQRLGFAYVNSGAIYRAITWYILQKGIDTRDVRHVTQATESAHIACSLQNNESRIFIDDVDPTDYLRDDRVNDSVSQVSRLARVREIAVQKMRDCVRNHDVVVEGRDIGSIVFPETPYKFYIDASPDVRLRRRAAQGEHDEIKMRDHADSSRPVSPLVIAQDAHVIDTSHLTLEGVVNQIIARLKQNGLHVSTCFNVSTMNVYYWLGYHLSRLIGRLFFSF